MKYSFLVFLLSCFQPVFSQDTLRAEMVSTVSYRFDIEDRQLSGQGADSLLSAMEKSHFVLLGETHDDAKIAEFTEAVLLEMSKTGYQYFLTEHGRFGLQWLLETIKDDRPMVDGLAEVNSSEHQRLNEFPFPFLTGVEDARFMAAAVNAGYHLYGLDQEFFYSFPFLFDRLYAKSSQSEAVKESYQLALAFLLLQYQHDAAEKNYPVCRQLLDAEEIETFFNLLISDKELKKVVDDIRQSWEIYEMNRTNRQASFTMRGELMKNRFEECYAAATSGDSSNTKFLIKMGAMHTMRGQTPLGINDIGEIVHQTAVGRGQKDLNIYFMFRYYLDDEEELGYFDNAEGNSSWLKERKPLMLQGDPDNWTIIDLKKLNEMTTRDKLVVYQPIVDIMHRHDYVIIPPASRDVIENRIH